MRLYKELEPVWKGIEDVLRPSALHLGLSDRWMIVGGLSGRLDAGFPSTSRNGDDDEEEVIEKTATTKQQPS